MKDGYLELNSNVTHRAGAHAWYTDVDQIRLVNLDPIALFNKYRSFSSSGKKIEEIDNAHFICLMHKLISSSRDSDDYHMVFIELMKLRKNNWLIIKQLKEIIMLEFN